MIQAPWLSTLTQSSWLLAFPPWIRFSALYLNSGFLALKLYSRHLGSLLDSDFLSLHLNLLDSLPCVYTLVKFLGSLPWFKAPWLSTLIQAYWLSALTQARSLNLGSLALFPDSGFLTFLPSFRPHISPPWLRPLDSIPCIYTLVRFLGSLPWFKAPWLFYASFDLYPNYLSCLYSHIREHNDLYSQT